MILLALSEFVRNIRRNMFIVFILTVMGLCLMGISSLLLFEYHEYLPMKMISQNQGFYLYNTGNQLRKELEEKVADLESLEGPAFCEVFEPIPNENRDKTYPMIAYPEWIWSNWSGQMQDGIWIDKTNMDKDLEVVVGGENAVLYPVGTKLYFKMLNGDKMEELVLKVIGHIKKDTKVFAGKIVYHAGAMDYRQFYDNPNAALYFVCKQEDLDAHELSYGLKGMNFILTSGSSSQDEMQKSLDNLNLSYNGTAYNLEEFTRMVDRTFLQQMGTYVPMLACGFILIIVCIYATACVNIESNKRYLSICYLLGSTPRQRGFMVTGNAFGICFMSALFLVTSLVAIYSLELGQSVVWIYGWQTILLLLVFYLFFFLLMSIMGANALKRLSVQDALRGTIK